MPSGNDAHSTDPSCPLVSICIVTRDRKERVVDAVESCFLQSYRPIEVVVVDDASEDGTAGAIEAAYPSVRLLRSERNVGLAGGRNLAMSLARGDLIVQIDDDVVLDPTAIATAVSCMERHPDAGVLMMNVHEHGSSRWPDHDDGRLLQEFVGCAHVLRHRAYEAVGPYYERLWGLRQGEEFEYSLRLLEEGFRIRYCRDAVARHFPSHSGFVPELAELSLINSSLAVVRHVPWTSVPALLVRRVIGYGALMVRSGAAGRFLRALARIAASLPRAIRSRRALPEGWSVYRRLDRGRRRERRE